MAIVFSFEDLYTSECETCGADLEDWNWLEDDMVFKTSCTCGAEYLLKPSGGNLSKEEMNALLCDEDEEEDEDE